MKKNKKKNNSKKSIKTLVLLSIFTVFSVGLVVFNIINTKTYKKWEDYYNMQYGAKTDYGKDYAIIRPILRSNGEIIYSIDDQLLTRGHKKYFVYFYSPGCSYCEKTETYVFRYLESSYNKDTDGVLLYACDISSGSTNDSHYASDSSSEKITDITHDTISELKILNFPCLVAVNTDEDGIKSIEAYWQGVSAIKNALNSRGGLY